VRDLSGKAAFITGGANGIGLGIARALAGQGVSLALADISEASLESAKAELIKTVPVATFKLDVRDREGFEACADSAEQQLGPINLLINNAGVSHRAPIEALTYAAWDWLLAINLGGVINGVQTFVPRMLRDQRDAYIVNTASAAGLVGGGSPGVLYATSKFAVVGLSEALRSDLKPYGVGVSVLCPGPVSTDILKRSLDLVPDEIRSKSDVGESLRRREASLAAGVPAGRVGEMVVEAILANRLYIHTDRFIDAPFRRRSEAVLAALPPEESN